MAADPVSWSPAPGARKHRAQPVGDRPDIDGDRRILPPRRCRGCGNDDSPPLPDRAESRDVRDFFLEPKSALQRKFPRVDRLRRDLGSDVVSPVRGAAVCGGVQPYRKVRRGRARVDIRTTVSRLQEYGSPLAAEKTGRAAARSARLARGVEE